MNLTESQEKAINHYKGPALVVAGPGAGKTFVITERVKNLIQKKKVNSSKILVTTFTEKAATELKVRLAKTIGDEAKKIHISTIHSFCKEMLEKYFSYHNYGSSLNILDDDDQNLVLDLKGEEFGYMIWEGGRKKPIKSFWNGIVPQVKQLYNNLTQNNINVNELIIEMKKNHSLEEWQEKVLLGYKKYRDYLEGERLFDFSLLQTNFYKLITEKEEVLNRVKDDFEFILIDEYQDTSPIQDDIFKLISQKHKNIFVVGDENQSIYGFRGASIRNFREFANNYEQSETYFLNSNFRSRKDIVDLSNEIFSGKIEKFLEAKREKGDKVMLLKAEDVNHLGKISIEFLQKLKKEKIIGSYGDVAFLCRGKRHMDSYVKYLSKQKIPYVTLGGEYFLEREEIKVVLFLLSYVTKNVNENRFKKWSEWWKKDIFLSNYFNFSQSTKDVILEGKFNLHDLNNYSDFSKEGFSVEKDIKVLLALNKLKSHFSQKIKEGKDQTIFLQIYYDILNETGYLPRLLGSRENLSSKESLKNIARLSKIISSYCSVRKKIDILGFLHYLHNYDEQIEQEKVEDKNCVKLMTVHKSKGLEFPVVFVCDLMEGRFPMKHKGNGFIEIPPEFLKESKVITPEEHYEEEKRLFYVAMTRAQDHLIFTTSSKINSNTVKQSRFLDEISPEYFCKDFSCCSEKKYVLAKKVPNLNYSAINMFLDCPLRYTLVYDYGFVTPSTFMENIGNFVHAALQRIHEKMKLGEELSLADISDIAKIYWINLAVSAEQNERMKAGYIRKLQKYYRNYAQKNYSEILGIEESFSHIDKNMVIKGRVDLIVKDKSGKNCIVDFKARSGDKLFETNVDLQLQIYDYCLDEKYDVDKVIAFTINDSKENSYGTDKLKIKEKLKEVSQKMDVENFHKHKNPFCKECMFRKFCWQKNEKL